GRLSGPPCRGLWRGAFRGAGCAFQAESAVDLSGKAVRRGRDGTEEDPQGAEPFRIPGGGQKSFKNAWMMEMKRSRGWEIFREETGQWFLQEMGQPTRVQKEAWPLNAAGRHTLVSAPTGT